MSSQENQNQANQTHSLNSAELSFEDLQFLNDQLLDEVSGGLFYALNIRDLRL